MRHTARAAFKHKAGGRSENMDFLEGYFSAVAFGGAFVAPAGTEAARVDQHSGIRRADGDERTGDEVLLADYNATMRMMRECRQTVRAAGLDGPRSWEYGKVLIEEVDAALQHGSTVTAGLEGALQRRFETGLALAAGRSSRKTYPSSSEDTASSSSSEPSDEDGSESGEIRSRKKKRAHKKKAPVKKSRKKSKGGSTKATGICYAWARKHLLKQGAGCTKPCPKGRPHSIPDEKTKKKLMKELKSYRGK